MSLILCKKEQVTIPFYIEKLGIHIYSSQELCYVIYNHPLLALDDFVDASLTDFMSQQLDLGFLVAKMDKWRKGGGTYDDLLVMILQECYYYNTQEISKFKQQIANFRKLHPAEYKKSVADYYYGLKQYGFAQQCYEQILAMPADRTVNDVFLGKVWNNIAACYTGVFWFEKALQAYDTAYGLSKSQELIKKIYFLTLMDTGLVLKERYQSILTEEKKSSWQQEFQEIKDSLYDSEQMKNMTGLFEKDQIRRMTGLLEILDGWRQEYRKMV